MTLDAAKRVGNEGAGLFEWSMKYQDGNSANYPRSTARPMAEPERQWLENALKSAMLDLGKRMQDIKQTLDGQPSVDSGDTAVSDKEQLLDELMDIVENIDQAKDLTSIGGLQTLLDLLSNSHASLRWRAAEVLAMCAQNNPDVQNHFTDAGVLPALWPLLDDADQSCQIKGLLALSCMVRGHAPGLAWFQEQGGPNKLCGLASRPNAKVQRKSLQLLDYVCSTIGVTTESQGCQELLHSPFLTILRNLSQSDDADLEALAISLLSKLTTRGMSSE